MHRIRNDHQFFIVRILTVLDHICISILTEITGMSLLPVNDQNSAANLIGIFQNRLIHKGLAPYHIPSAIGVKGTGVIATVSLVVIMIVCNEEWCILRNYLYHTSAKLIFVCLEIFQTLRTHSFLLLVAGFFTILRIKISVGIYSCHVIHRGCNCCLDSCIKSCRIDCHTTPATDANDTDTFRINLII